MGKLEGKIALITGGNSGIGLATAKEFVNEGAYVFITGRRERELAAAVDTIGKNVIGIQGDMAKLADLDRVYAKIKQDKGRLDIVFANAGIAKSAALGDTTEELYDATFGVNVKGVLFTVQKALPLMPDGAAIVLNASVVGSKGLASNSVYSATKAAVRSFAHLDDRPEVAPHSCQCDIARIDRHAGLWRVDGLIGGRAAAAEDADQHRADGAAWQT